LGFPPEEETETMAPSAPLAVSTPGSATRIDCPSEVTSTGPGPTRSASLAGAPPRTELLNSAAPSPASAVKYAVFPSGLNAASKGSRNAAPPLATEDTDLTEPSPGGDIGFSSLLQPATARLRAIAPSHPACLLMSFSLAPCLPG